MVESTAENPTRPVTVLAIDRPARSAFPLHTHDLGQLIHAITGVMIVRAEAGDWVVPTGRAVWVPAGTRHTIEAANNIQIRTVFVVPDARADLPDECQVLGVSSLLRELIVSAAAFRADEIPGARAERIMALILDEIESHPGFTARADATPSCSRRTVPAITGAAGHSRQPDGMGAARAHE